MTFSKARSNAVSSSSASSSFAVSMNRLDWAGSSGFGVAFRDIVRVLHLWLRFEMFRGKAFPVGRESLVSEEIQGLEEIYRLDSSIVLCFEGPAIYCGVRYGKISSIPSKMDVVECAIKIPMIV